MIITDFKQLEPFRHKSGIYIFINKKDPTKCYVGKSINLYRRIAIDHKNAQNKNQYIDNVIKKYGLLKYFNIELIHWWDGPVDNLVVLALETACIDAYNCLKNKGGYNTLLFGGDRTGIPHSEQTKKRMSQTRLDKHKNGYISPNLGKKHTKEQNTKHSNMLKKYLATHIHPNLNHTIYKFQHKLTKQIFEGTKYNFYTKFNLRGPNCSNMINGKRKSVNNWILI